MTSWTRGVCEANGIRIAYTRTGGDRQPIVLLHGLIGSGACWTPIARLLERELDVVMPDARGHGASSAPAHGYRYDDLAADVIGLIHGLALSPAPILLGHSMGGMTAAVVASRGGGISRGLILVDPTFLGPERQREVAASDVAEQHRRVRGLPIRELVAEARARHPHRSLEILELLAHARSNTSMSAFDILTPPNPDYRDVVRAVDVPILLVIGDRPVVTPGMAAELREINPRLRVVQLEDAGHGVPYDQPERLSSAVLAFLHELA